MNRISYNLVLTTFYPNAVWSMIDGGKGYQYESYIWDKSNAVPKPSKATLDAKWEEIKRGTHLWSIFLHQRNQRLKDTDYLIMPDYPHATEQVRQSWLDYRQALRDLPDTADPYYDSNGEVAILWPTKPQ